MEQPSNTPLSPFRALAAAALLAACGTAHAAPPFEGTAFIDPDILTSASPSSFVSLSYAGMGVRTMFDRRTNAFASYNVFLFNATYADRAGTVEFQVNAEFGNHAVAHMEALLYAVIVGQTPRVLRERLLTVWMHRGDEAFGGGNDNLLIHVGNGDGLGIYADYYLAHGVMEEIVLHELSHTSLDPNHAAAPGWLAAQQADPEFLSTYARDNPTREDIAETFGPWLAVRCNRSALTPTMAATIEAAVPNRLAYFDARGFNLNPVVCVPGLVFANGFEGAP